MHCTEEHQWTQCWLRQEVMHRKIAGGRDATFDKNRTDSIFRNKSSSSFRRFASRFSLPNSFKELNDETPIQIVKP